MRRETETQTCKDERNAAGEMERRIWGVAACEKFNSGGGGDGEEKNERRWANRGKERRDEKEGKKSMRQRMRRAGMTEKESTEGV